ncbi:esterase family protein [Mycolicibacterium fluoranthenivorans]|uniref:Esterase family protein n=1 Tax=Mycolicibacterium fluoranthenivorans TaxID=258505 RepID=A0A7G8PMS6_9MYCO|nr:alpha/beta hydrolase-fold protein [Mycolicibacterium fluoranthenivorans]QNJ95642.1 esterase family protein [Mycolicibacterium fluoranthenivorans]
MWHFLGTVPLTHGLLPPLIEIATLALVVPAAVRRGRRRVLALAAVCGVALAGGVHSYIAAIGIAGDPAPRPLWLWIALTGFCAVVAVLGWVRTRWWRRVVSVAAVPACALCAVLMINAWVGYFPTVNSAWTRLAAPAVPDQADRMTVTELQLAHAHPAHGVVLPVTISPAASRFAHRDELVYLPPAWFASNPPPRLPTVMMIGAQLNTPADWLRAGDAAATIDAFAAAHGGTAPVFVFVDPTGSFDNDTECVNGTRGNASLHLTKDVVPYMISNFGVSPDRSRWGIMGWSMGGTCAVELSVRRPELFSAFVDIAGDLGPNSGTKEQSIDRLFGGDSAAWAEFDPATVMARHGRYTDLSARFVVPSGEPGHDPLANPEGQDVAANTLNALARTYGIDGAVQTWPGRHDWAFASRAFAATLPWLADRLGIAGTPNPAVHAA